MAVPNRAGVGARGEDVVERREARRPGGGDEGRDGEGAAADPVAVAEEEGSEALVSGGGGYGWSISDPRGGNVAPRADARFASASMSRRASTESARSSPRSTRQQG